MENDIEVKNLTQKYFGNYSGVSRVSFSMKDNFLIYGKLGSGKSSLLKTIAQIEKASEGEVFLNGKNIKDIDPRLRNLAYYFNEKTLNKFKTVYDNIAYTYKVKGQSVNDERIKYYLQRYDLYDYKDYKVGKLNYSQKRLVSLVRLLQREDAIFLVDGPLEKVLDREKYFELLKEDLIGKKYIYASDDIQEIISFNKPFAVMAYTKYLQYGTLDELRKRPIHVEVLKAIYEDVDFIEYKLEKIGDDFYLNNIKTKAPISDVYINKNVLVSKVNEIINYDIYYDINAEFIVSKK